MSGTTRNNGHMADDWGDMDPQIYCLLLNNPGITDKQLLQLGDRIVEGEAKAFVQELLGEEASTENNTNN